MWRRLLSHMQNFRMRHNGVNLSLTNWRHILNWAEAGLFRHMRLKWRWTMAVIRNLDLFAVCVACALVVSLVAAAW
ncbi:MAG: hypothetical protein ACK5JM_01000 [Rhodoblastus sp.]